MPRAQQEFVYQVAHESINKHTTGFNRAKFISEKLSPNMSKCAENLKVNKIIEFSGKWICVIHKADTGPVKNFYFAYYDSGYIRFQLRGVSESKNIQVSICFR